jgi:hypothetical protein
MADNLLREVDAALRAERAASIWQNHRTLLIGIATIIILAVAAKSAWWHLREARGGDVLLALNEAKNLIVAGKPGEASKAFAAIAATQAGERQALAYVWQARADLAANNPVDAIEALRNATATGNHLWSDIACLRLAGLDAVAATPCLNAPETSPLQVERRKWAAAQAWEAGDATRAIATLEPLAANEANSPELREYLNQWLGVMKASKE